jgi:hypothetical protein
MCALAATAIRRAGRLMSFEWLATAVVAFHACFVVFVVAGGFIALRWRWLMVLHVPAVVWAVLLEYNGWVCPLTPLENVLRERAGLAGYAGGFIQHYLLRELYPDQYTTAIRWTLGTFALAVNVVAYCIIIRRFTKTRPSGTGRSNPI